MRDFTLEGTQKTPKIHGDAQSAKIRISGNCLPEDARETFRPFIDWVENLYSQKPDKVVVEFDLLYFNTASAKIFLDFLRMIMHFKDDVKTEILWLYEEDDIEIKESGKTFQTLLGDMLVLVSKSI